MGKQSNSWVDPEFGMYIIKTRISCGGHSFICAFIHSADMYKIPHMHRILCKVAGIPWCLRSRVLVSRSLNCIRRILDSFKDQCDMGYNRDINKRRKNLIMTWRIRDGFSEEVAFLSGRSFPAEQACPKGFEIYIVNAFFMTVTVPASPNSGWSFKL